MFLVVPWLDMHFDFNYHFFACSIGRASKIVRLKRNLSTPKTASEEIWKKTSINVYLILKTKLSE